MPDATEEEIRDEDMQASQILEGVVTGGKAAGTPAASGAIDESAPKFEQILNASGVTAAALSVPPVDGQTPKTSELAVRNAAVWPVGNPGFQDAITVASFVPRSSGQAETAVAAALDVLGVVDSPVPDQATVDKADRTDTDTAPSFGSGTEMLLTLTHDKEPGPATGHTPEIVIEAARTTARPALADSTVQPGPAGSPVDATVVKTNAPNVRLPERDTNLPVAPAAKAWPPVHSDNTLISGVESQSMRPQNANDIQVIPGPHSRPSVATAANAAIDPAPRIFAKGLVRSSHTSPTPDMRAIDHGAGGENMPAIPPLRRTGEPEVPFRPTQSSNPVPLAVAGNRPEALGTVATVAAPKAGQGVDIDGTTVSPPAASAIKENVTERSVHLAEPGSPDRQPVLADRQDRPTPVRSDPPRAGISPPNTFHNAVIAAPVQTPTVPPPTIAIPPVMPVVTQPSDGGRQVMEDHPLALDDPTIIGVSADSKANGIANHRGSIDAPTARAVSLQLADIARQMPDRPVEITLDPEELGRVRMTLSASDGTMTVSLAVERAETADLLRRHLESLARDFHEIGFSDVNFTFQGDGGADGDTESNESGPSNAVLSTEGLDESGQAPLRVRLTDGVDIRL